MSLLTTKQFKQVDSDPTKTVESKVQRTMRKLKSTISPYEYKKLYPTGSSPGKFQENFDIILRRIYDHKELEIQITKSEMKEMLTLSTKNVHFTYNRKIFVQTDGINMGSPLGPGLADILMTELEKTLLPDIYIRYMKFWRRYVDDTVFYVKIDSIKHKSFFISNCFTHFAYKVTLKN